MLSVTRIIGRMGAEKIIDRYKFGRGIVVLVRAHSRSVNTPIAVRANALYSMA